jgi:methanogenic corrinoid protein MtbC1
MKHADLQAAEALEAVSRAVTEWTVDRMFTEDASMEARYGVEGRRLWRNEMQTRLAHLAEAIATGEPRLFTSNAAWSKAAFLARDMGEDDLTRSLRCMASVIKDSVPNDIAARAGSIIDASMHELAGGTLGDESVLDHLGEDGTLARLFLLQLLQRDREAAERIVQDLLEGNMPLAKIYERVIAPAMNEIGRMWQLQEATIADEHYCTASTLAIMARLRGQLQAKPSNGLLAITCSSGGDLHELGIRMVSDLFELEGWRVECLGANMPADEVAAAAGPQQHRGPANLVAISAGTPLAMRSVARLVQALRATPHGQRVAVMVGGLPFHLADGLWRTVGADGFAPSASSAPTLALQLVKARAGSVHA